MGGKGSGSKRCPEAQGLDDEAYRQFKLARARRRSRERAQLKRDGLMPETELEAGRKWARERNRKRREFDRTPEGRAILLAKRRTGSQWVSALCAQLHKKNRNAIKGISKSRSPRTVTINAAWIRAQYEKQQGRCFYTGIPFELVERKRGIRRPSLDRVDPAGDYTPDNVVLCLMAVNYMKNDYGLDEFMALLLEIAGQG